MNSEMFFKPVRYPVQNMRLIITLFAANAASTSNPSQRMVASRRNYGSFPRQPAFKTSGYLLLWRLAPQETLGTASKLPFYSFPETNACSPIFLSVKNFVSRIACSVYLNIVRINLNILFFLNKTCILLFMLTSN